MTKWPVQKLTLMIMKLVFYLIICKAVEKKQSAVLQFKAWHILFLYTVYGLNNKYPRRILLLSFIYYTVQFARLVFDIKLVGK